MNEMTLIVEEAIPGGNLTTVPLDVAFSVRGDRVPMDHGYVLYAALSRVMPWLHDATDVGIHPLHGEADGRSLKLKPSAALQFRLPPEQLGALAGLIGATLDLAGHPLRLGTFTAYPLRPRAVLRARFVTIKGFTEPEPFRGALERQAKSLEIQAAWTIGRRQVMAIQGKKVVGFEVMAEDLTPEDSLKLQAQGLGGRRKMGAGLFVPARPRAGGPADA